jgi:hypothetical protein
VIKTELRDQRCGQTVTSESRRLRRPFQSGILWNSEAAC